jgi:hypothetical protein
MHTVFHTLATAKAFAQTLVEPTLSGQNAALPLGANSPPMKLQNEPKLRSSNFSSLHLGNQRPKGDRHMISTLRRSLSDGIPFRSGCVALVVGTILNLINQGDAIFSATSVNWTKIMLTYFVPYVVSTYGAVSYRLSRPPQ